jgi:hypothetical protein
VDCMQRIRFIGNVKRTIHVTDFYPQDGKDVIHFVDFSQSCRNRSELTWNWFTRSTCRNSLTPRLQNETICWILLNLRTMPCFSIPQWRRTHQSSELGSENCWKLAREVGTYPDIFSSSPHWGNKSQRGSL